HHVHAHRGGGGRGGPRAAADRSVDARGGAAAAWAVLGGVRPGVAARGRPRAGGAGGRRGAGRHPPAQGGPAQRRAGGSRAGTGLHRPLTVADGRRQLSLRTVAESYGAPGPRTRSPSPCERIRSTGGSVVQQPRRRAGGPSTDPGPALWTGLGMGWGRVGVSL